jgi:hypothetical protein
MRLPVALARAKPPSPGVSKDEVRGVVFLVILNAAAKLSSGSSSELTVDFHLRAREHAVTLGGGCRVSSALRRKTEQT